MTYAPSTLDCWFQQLTRDKSEYIKDMKRTVRNAKDCDLWLGYSLVDTGGPLSAVLYVFASRDDALYYRDDLHDVPYMIAVWWEADTPGDLKFSISDESWVTKVGSNEFKFVLNFLQMVSGQE